MIGFDLSIYTYFWGSLFGLLITGLLFYYKPKYRRLMIINGVSVAIIGFILEYFFMTDYWTPQLLLRFGKFGGIEDLIFGFVAGAIGCVIPNIINKDIPKLWKAKVFRIISFYLFTLIVQILLILSARYLEINSIYASSAGLLLCSFLIQFEKKKFMFKSIVGGITVGLVLVALESVFLHFVSPNYLERYFLLHNKVMVIGNYFVTTELIWGICFGLFISVISDIDTFSLKKEFRF